MARRQVLVQLDDELVDQLDRIVDDEGGNRSELIRRAVRAWIEARREVRWDREHRRAYARHPQDAALVESLARLAAEGAPPYDA